jgi:hypothetical protein
MVTPASRFRQTGIALGLLAFGLVGRLPSSAPELKAAQPPKTQPPTTQPPANTNTKAVFGPVMERVLPSGPPCREQLFQFYSGQVFVVGNGPGTSEAEAAIDERRIDEAGGVDMRAGASDEAIHIEGRGCFFTRDVNDLAWDRITADQVVQAIARARDINGVVTPRKADLPITYLFKTAHGETGVIEVLGAAADEGSGRGMKFRYKLVLGSGTTREAAAAARAAGAVSSLAGISLVYGPATKGLEAALEVTPGEPYRLRIHVRNASDRALSINGVGYRQTDECLLTDAQGRPVPVTKVTHDIPMGLRGGYFGPGQVMVFESAGLSFQDVVRAPASAGYVAQAPSGRYTLRIRLRLPGDDIPFAADSGVWRGELETGPAVIDITVPSKFTVTPVADAPYSANLGPAIERTVNDLGTTRENCALSFDTGKLLSVPSDLTLDTFAQPPPQKALAWAKAGDADAVGFVTVSAGKVVKCGLYAPGLMILRANNKEWNPDQSSPRDLKEYFDEAMHSRGFIPPVAELSCDADFPQSFMILETRTHRRGILQITGVVEKPLGVKIRYRLVEPVAVRTVFPPATPAGR